jgi:hypothetical protein
VLALLSGVIGAVIQSYTTQSVSLEENAALIAIERLKADASIELERQNQEFAERLERAQFETTLILKAIEAPQREDQIRNLKFFLNAEFITDPDGKIAGMDEDAFPSLAPPQLFSERETLGATIDGLDAAGAKALVINIETVFPAIKPLIDAQYPQSIRAADQTGGQARSLLKRAVVWSVRSMEDVDKWQGAINSL